MLDRLKRKKQLILSLITCCVLSHSNHPLLSALEPEDPSKPDHERLGNKKKDAGYTINFTNVSIKEYLKFISKIASVNFIYDDADLNFTVNIVSEEPTDLANILSALIQVLKIHGLSLIEEGSNLIINKAPITPQIATIISDDFPYKGDKPPVLITRLFKIKNANPNSLATILQTLLSQTALIEVSRESRHIIITDSPANIDKVTDLLVTLDSPQSPLEIDAYTAQNNHAANLVLLATQIITPLSEGNPVIMVPQPSTNTIFLVSTPFLIEKTLAILEDLDATPIVRKEKLLSGDNIFLYQLQYKPAQILEKALHQITEDLEQLGYTSEGLVETLDTVRYIPDTNSLLFTGDALNLKKLQELIAGLDTPDKRLPSSSFFIYKPLQKSSSDLLEILNNFAQTLTHTSSFNNINLTNALQSAKIIESSGTILFTGDAQSIQEIQEILKTIDVPSIASLNQNFYLYPLKYSSEEQLARALTGIADNLENSQYPDRELIKSIDTMKWIKETNAFFFTGTDHAIKQLQEILTAFDTPYNDLAEFYMYSPQHLEGEDLLKAVNTLSLSLQDSGLANPALLKTLTQAQWIPSSHALVFTGSPEVLNRIKLLMPSIDQINTADLSATYIYHSTHLSSGMLSKTLRNLADNLPKGDELQTIILSMRASDNTLIFKGSPSSIEKLKELLVILDTEQQAHLISGTATYTIYKLKAASGDSIIEDLDRIVKNLHASGFEDKDFVHAINSIEWIKSTNALYIAGTPESLKKIELLLEEFDVPIKGAVPSDYLIYKPQYMSPQEILDKLHATEQGLQTSGLANPELLSAIKTVQYVETTSSLVFSGTAGVIAEIKNILTSIESSGTPPSSLQQFGKRTYLIYKLKFVPGPQLIGNLRSILQDLTASNPEDRELINAIHSAKFIPETNSVMFTGSSVSLEDLQKIIDKFDIAALAPQIPMISQAYVIYQPLHLQAPALIQILHDFEQQLINSGLQEPDLFSAINHLKYLEQTGSITISGTQEAVKQVEELLKKFDIQEQKDLSKTADIGQVQDLSFLIYKLKYHQGSEIEDALKKIAAEIAMKQGKNNALVESIESLQWIQVTNSLISTGSPQALAKLKNLIENVDTPLEQIFIEILVIETDITNALTFGLRWGGQGQYRTKLGYSMGAFPQFPPAADGTSTGDPLNAFNTALQQITASTTPTGGAIPFSTGFGLGVIGDLIYHKGQSYTALGSLIDCLREDDSSTIILSQKIITQDNKPATIFVGDNIPFTGSTVQNAGTNATVFSANLEYKDIGVSLNLTPRVGDEGLISLDIDQEITEDLNTGTEATASTSGSASAGSITSPSVFGITTSKTSMQTQATVPNKHFLILSGMMRNQKVKSRSGIPCLGGLPIIGAAFSNTSTQIVKKNVIIFVRPEIIENFKVYKEITARQEDLFRSQAITEDYDQGLELVKTPDDE